MGLAEGLLRDAPSAPWGAPALLLRNVQGDRGVVLGQFDDATEQYVPFRR